MAKYERKKKITWLIVVPAMVLLLLCSGLAVQMLFVFPWGQPLLRSSTEADLRELEMTVEEYTALAAELPDCHILWMIPIGDQRYDCTSAQIVVDSVETEDFPLYAMFDDLQRIDAMDAECYEELMALQAFLPDCTVDWAVHLGSGGFSSEAQTLDLNGTGITADELAEKLKLFPDLTRVEITDTVFSWAEQTALMAGFPDVTFVWNVEISGSTWLSTDTQLSFEGKKVDAENLIGAADKFYGVMEIDLSGCGCTTEELLAIREAYGAAVRSELSLYGLSFTTETTELDLSDIPMEDTAAVEQILPLMPNLQKVTMCNCGIPSEEMDAMWKRNPQVRFVWSVKIGRATIRTDCTNFIGVKFGYLADPTIVDPRQDAYHRLFDEDCTEFKYCVDMVCLDLGHMGITDYSFLEYMPNLKYLILADTHGTDFSVLENLTELVFLELFLTDFNQTEVLLNLTKLEDMNIGFTPVSDPEYLKQMTWLDRLWIPATKLSYSECVEIKEALADTQVDYSAEHSTANGWRKGQNYYDMRDLLGMYYLE